MQPEQPGAPSPEPVAAPAISAPKGGGAIRGLGEKFAADPLTGAGTLAVPIALPAARSGFAPQLTLGYNSAAGNGVFGVGWQVPLPAITRKTEKGLPRYADAVGSDVFLLSGAEDLVPDPGPETERLGHRVRRFRPRIEGTFARIERWTRISDGEVHWRTISRDNVLSVYGFDAASRVFDPADPRRVFGWSICAAYDDRGNAIAYEYSCENAAGVDPGSVNEAHRVYGANRHPRRIRYGNRVPLLLDPDVPGVRAPHTPAPDLDGADWMFDVVFDYGQGHYRELPPEPDGQVPVEAHLEPPAGGSWPMRRDPFSSYRAGFEVRTARLCRRLLVFHHFPDELGVEDYLVRSVGLRYAEAPTGSFLTGVVQCGHRRRADGRFRTAGLPRLEFGYTPSPLADPEDLTVRLEVRTLDSASTRNLPGGVDGIRHRWIDLYGEGIAGSLTEQADAWFYKPNLGAGRLGAQQRLATLPGSTALDAGRSPLGALQALVDIGGDGNTDLVSFAPPAPGLTELTPDGGWQPFRTFRRWPVRSWTDGDLRLADLTGDGLVDVLVTEDACLTWHPGLGEDGFGAAVRVRARAGDRGGPRVVFADPEQSIHLADMSGDGMADLVRVRSGDICYWPNLGYGRFGAKVTMDRAPVLDRPGMFDQRRVRLADVDGTGPVDLVYLGADGVRIYLNESGNAWSAARRLPGLPTPDNAAAVTAVDLLGRGTACLVWSSPLPGNARAPVRYVDLTAGRKPCLLDRVRNNLGAECAVEYTPSTEFFLADRAAGRPWITRLPFPVHVVARVETYDRIARNRFVTRNSYHHGYFDPVEREFRGFARVDTMDTEEFGALSTSGSFPTGDNVDASSHVPPVLTRTWYHTGVYLGGGRVSRLLAGEYYRAPGLTGAQQAATLLEDTVLPAGLGPEAAREAARAFKGTVLRREVYALDGRPGPAKPYVVTETAYRVRVLRPPAAGRPGVYLSHPAESLESHYERGDEPRLAHALTLRVDNHGTVLLAAGVAYGRHPGADPSLSTVESAAQERTSVSFTVRTPTNAVSTADGHRVPAAAQTSTYELVNVAPGDAGRFTPRALRALIKASGDGAHDLPYADVAGAGVSGTAPFRRLVECERTFFRADTLATDLPLGQLQAFAVPLVSQRLGLTAGLAATRYVDTGKVPAADLGGVLGEAGYEHSENSTDWWTSSARVRYAAAGDPAAEWPAAVAGFFQPYRSIDAFGNESTVEYDPHALLPVRTRDPAGNLVSAGERDAGGAIPLPGNDYRVLQPALVMDANRNRTATAFDTLGLMAGSAVMGKPEDADGDSLTGFDPDGTALGPATSRLVYDLGAYTRTAGTAEPSPVVVQTLTRETHRDGASAVHRRYAYSDGFGREIQGKSEAEPGPLVEGGPVAARRWSVTGWTISDNKGQPVRRYEPFFDDSPGFRFRHLAGVSAIAYYDPIGRMVARLHPDHSWEKLVVGAWRRQHWDRNDTVAVADPAADPDVGDFFRRLPAAAYTPTWLAARAGGALGPAEDDAATKATAHSGTPATTHLDPLGRAFLTVALNRFTPPGAAQVERDERSRIVFDVEGNRLAGVDAEGRTFLRQEFDLLGNRIHLSSMDSGRRWALVDVAGRPVRGWDAVGHAFHTEYDELRRPVRRFARGSSAASDPATIAGPVLFETVEYGEGRPDAEDRNLRTRTFRSRDGAGEVTMERYDFKGNPVTIGQRLVADTVGLADWAGGGPAMDPDVFTNTTAFDALNRATSVVTPDGSTTRPGYNTAGLLETVEVELHGVPVGFVTGIDYDAHGRRTRIAYTNGAVTEYRYDRLTHRLAGLVTTRPGVPDATAGQLFAALTVVQDLRYTYDPMGNVTRVHDAALRTVFHDGQRVEPVRGFTYDAVYRLVAATGREHVGQSGFAPPGGWRDHPFAGAAALADLQALRGYTDRYGYDRVGNLTEVRHAADGGGWTRGYTYNETSPLESGRHSNRLTSTAPQPAGGVSTVEGYGYDDRGVVTAMPHTSLMSWDFRERLVATATQVVGGGAGETTRYRYSGGGQRVRKVTRRPNGSRRCERLYLRGCELYREYDGSGTTVVLASQTLHVADAERRIALVESTVFDGAPVADPVPVTRYQLGDPLNSVTVELDPGAALITYEEYAPYGGTAFQAGRSAAEVSLKRYRHAGRERDEESGLVHTEQRYCAPWLGRWISCDPRGPVDGPNLYEYARSNPLGYTDPSGTRAVPAVRVPDPLPDTAVGGQDPATGDGGGERAPPGEGPDAQPGADGGKPAGPANAQQPSEQPAEQPSQQADAGAGAPPSGVPASRPADAPPATRPGRDAAGDHQPGSGRADPLGEQRPAPLDERPTGPSSALASARAPANRPAQDAAPARAGEAATAEASRAGPTVFGVPLLSGIMFLVSLLTFLAVLLLTLDQGVSAVTWWVRGITTAIWVAAALKLGSRDIVNKAGDGNIDKQGVDRWSLIHGGAGVIFGLWGVPFPVVAAVTVLWEVFEAVYAGFGEGESFRNRAVDVGVAWLGWLLFAGAVAVLDHRPMPWLLPVRESWARDRWLRLF